MAQKRIKFTAQIIGENGEDEITVASSKEIPDFSDFETQGFAAAFHELEGAVLEASKDVNTKITEQYLGEGSKKKSMTPKKK